MRKKLACKFFGKNLKKGEFSPSKISEGIKIKTKTNLKYDQPRRENPLGIKRKIGLILRQFRGD